MITEPSSQICMFNIIRIGFLFVCLQSKNNVLRKLRARLLKELASLHWRAASSMATIPPCVLAKPAQALQFHSLKPSLKIMNKSLKENAQAANTVRWSDFSFYQLYMSKFNHWVVAGFYFKCSNYSKVSLVVITNPGRKSSALPWTCYWKVWNHKVTAGWYLCNES